MWRVQALIGRQYEAIPFESIEGKPWTTQSVLDHAPKLLDTADVHAPLHLVKQVARQGLEMPWANSIAHWGNKIKNIEEWQDRIRFDEEILALIWDDGTTESIVWHDDTLVIVPVKKKYRRLKFEYEPEENSTIFCQQRSKRLYPYFCEGYHRRVRTRFEWRAYIGINSGIIDGVSTFWRRDGVSSATHFSGLLVGSVVHMLSRGPRTIISDPLWEWNRDRLEIKYKAACENFANLETADIVSEDQAACIVLVHGTFSSSMHMAHSLEELDFKIPVVRFEHDTFKSVAENAEKLAKLIHERIKAPNVLLVGHSRGGLVSSAAAINLHLGKSRQQVQVWTYGTPHDGTSLVRAGAKTLGWLYRQGADLVSGIFVPTPLQGAMSYFLGSAGLPPGIAEMEPGCSSLDRHQRHLQYLDLSSRAAIIDPETTHTICSASGFEKGFAKSIFGGIENDLVVPRPSANFFNPQPVLTDCSHFNFFEHDVVKQELVDYQSKFC